MASPPPPPSTDRLAGLEDLVARRLQMYEAAHAAPQYCARPGCRRLAAEGPVRRKKKKVPLAERTIGSFRFVVGHARDFRILKDHGV